MTSYGRCDQDGNRVGIPELARVAHLPPPIRPNHIRRTSLDPENGLDNYTVAIHYTTV